MRLRLASRLILALSLGRIHASIVPSHERLTFLDLPIEIRERVFEYGGMVAYAQAQKAIGNSVPLVTLEFEPRLLGDAAQEVKHLDIYDDTQRARLSAMLEATRAAIGRRSGLPTSIPPDTDLNSLEHLAARFETAFLEYTSLSSSPTWAKFCLAGLLGKDTLTRLLPFLAEGFVSKNLKLMFQAAAIVEDLDTLWAVANYSELSSGDLRLYIEYDAPFGGSVEVVQKIINVIPDFISTSRFLLNTAIRLNHLPLFQFLYDKTANLSLEPWKLDNRIKWAFQAIAGRGWEDIFKQLYAKHPQCLDMEKCLMEAATHGRINILKLLLYHDDDLAQQARTHVNSAFEAAVGSGNIEVAKVLLDKDERGNSIIPHLCLTQPSPNILWAVGVYGRWEGIEYLMQLKKQGDARFDKFELAGDASGAVEMACCYGNLRVLRQLLKKDPQGQFIFTIGQIDLQQALRDACYHGHLPIVHELLQDSTVDPAYDNHEALMAACAGGHHLVVRELLRDTRVDACARDGASLIIACEQGHLLVVRELLKGDGNGKHLYDVEPAAKDNEALIAACKNGNLLIVRELLQHKRVNPGARGGEPLIIACRRGHLLVIQELLQKHNNGTYVYAGISPATGINQCLIEACENGHLTIVKFLVQKRPNAHGATEYVHLGSDAAAQGNMALLRATKGHHIKIVEFLLQKTDKRDALFPGLLVTEEMLEAAEQAKNQKLKALLTQRIS